MNPVLMFAYNNLHLTQDAVWSVLAQDIPVELYVFNNGSTDGTREWLDYLASRCANVHVIHYEENQRPTTLANEVTPKLLSSGYLLGVPNDVRLPSNCYSQMLRWKRGFICATDHGRTDPVIREATAVSELTPMAVMLTRKWAFEAVADAYGTFFDEGFVHYASDCDIALRMAACGIRGVQLDIPFWHYGSATWRCAPEKEQRAMLDQADADRDYFERKWGFRVEDARYGELAGDINFLGIPSADAPRIHQGDMARS